MLLAAATEVSSSHVTMRYVTIPSTSSDKSSTLPEYAANPYSTRAVADQRGGGIMMGALH